MTKKIASKSRKGETRVKTIDLPVPVDWIGAKREMLKRFPTRVPAARLTDEGTSEP